MNEAEGKIFLCLIALCLDEPTKENETFVRTIGKIWDVSEGSIEGSVTMIGEIKLEKAESMATGLRASLNSSEALCGIATLLLLLVRGPQVGPALLRKKEQRPKRSSQVNDEAVSVSCLKYDAHASVLLRRLAALLRIKASTVSALEDLAIIDLQRESQLQAAEENESSKNGKRWRRSLKIGAAAAAAGGLLAVTGGLAAPALAAGLAGLGLSAAAGLTTAATLATLLGASGAGLGAYKMSKRTSSISEFSFERINNYSQYNGMTVYLCISGYLRSVGSSSARDAPDFYSPWGAEAPNMTPRQILERYYDVVDPEKRYLVPALLRNFQDVSNLYEALSRRYGIHPCRMASSYDARQTNSSCLSLLEVASERIQLILNPKRLDQTTLPSPDSVQNLMDERKDISDFTVSALESVNGEGVPLGEMDAGEAQHVLESLSNDSGEEPSSSPESTELKNELENLESSNSVNETRSYDWRKDVDACGDQYTLLWEPERLVAIGKSLESLVREGISKGVAKGLQFTVLQAVVSAIALPVALLGIVNSLDEAWTMASQAADEAGVLLAQALIEQEKRPVVLMGYSTGGRVVAKCLSELARQGATHIVRDAIIVGAPVSTTPREWAARKSVVSGRLINVYHSQDWILAILYRYKRWSVSPLAGLQPVKGNSGVENHDVAEVVRSHHHYPSALFKILEHIHWNDGAKYFK